MIFGPKLQQKGAAYTRVFTVIIIIFNDLMYELFLQVVLLLTHLFRVVKFSNHMVDLEQNLID